MASTYKFHSQVNETVPWQANYTFPSQSTKVSKQSVKLNTKTGGIYSPGQTCRIEFPADNYLNVLNSVLLLDLTVTTQSGTISLQRGGAHNLIKRLVVRYGSMVIEDIQDYKTLVRIFTEAGVQQDYMTSTGSILDGMYDVMEIAPGASSTTTVAQEAVAGLANVIVPSRTAGSMLTKDKRTYALNLMSGLLTSKKLIPLKWMASQLSIELTWASPAEAFVGNEATAVPNSNVVIENVFYLAEMVEFDSAYDAAFVAGLEAGVPIKFSSWHYHSFNITGTTSILQIHERSRSVKAAFAVMKSSLPASNWIDSDLFFHNGTSVIDSATGLITYTGESPIGEYQFRVGGKYYPSQPVSCRYGGAEAFVELQKCMNSLGDYTRAGNINFLNWTRYGTFTFNPTGQKFIMSAEFENVDVMPDTIAGINAEEQSDISLTVKLDGSAVFNKKIDVFIHYDCLLIIRKDNLVELVM